MQHELLRLAVPPFTMYDGHFAIKSPSIPENRCGSRGEDRLVTGFAWSKRANVLSTDPALREQLYLFPRLLQVRYNASP